MSDQKTIDPKALIVCQAMIEAARHGKTIELNDLEESWVTWQSTTNT
jgi:hypothetical protein